MELLTTSAGNYPRVGDSPERQKLRRAYASWEQGEISDEEMEEAYRAGTKEVIQEQIRAGLDLVTDGQLRWYDQLSHFARKLEGCEIDGLLRFFDTNFYFRQPVVVGDVKWREPIVKDEFQFAKGVSSVPVKPVITGPYTMAKYSIDRHYGDFHGLALDYAKALSNELKELDEAGAEEIQVDEPAILKNLDDFGVLNDAISELIRPKKNVRVALYTYFGDAAPLYGKLARLPVDVLGLDFTYSSGLPEKIAKLGCEKGLGLGLIDGRNTRLEGEREVLDVLERVLPNVGSDRIYLNPSCGLDYLPRGVAFRKLQNMVKIIKKARGVLG
jgi:5-methyltetrahydropteroyltriglutamate--homocysteine methyltransferase